MTDIKRYEIFLDGFERYVDYKEAKDGDWIKASDHDKAMAEKLKEIERIKKQMESGLLTLNQVKADAVRLAIEECAWQGGEIYVSDLHLFANKLERGEV